MFEFRVGGLVVEDLTHDLRSHLFKDKAFLLFELEQTTFRSESQLLENVTRFECRQALLHEVAHVATMQHAVLRVRLAIKPPREQRKTPLYNDERQLVGEASVPLWVLAAGPVDHNLPLRDAQGRQRARLRMSIGFEQRAHVAVVFGSVEWYIFFDLLGFEWF